MKNYKAVFLSPHFDDAVLSCGGAISQLNKEGPILVVTVFGGGGEKYFKVKRRIEEEIMASKILKYDFEIWDFMDAVYRSPLNHFKLFRHRNFKNPPAFFKNLVHAIKALEKSGEPPIYYVPLGIGNHIDHQLTRLAALQALPKNKICFYEDIPYSFEKSFFCDDLILQIKPVVDWNKKVEAVSAYASQPKPIKQFLNSKKMEERFWIWPS